MDDQKKEQFRWKFYLLALMLNGTILLVAVAMIVFFLAPAFLKLPLVLLLLILALALGLVFRRSYYRAKQWLDENSDPKESKRGTETAEKREKPREE
ncbi:MAG: hypothetical protein ABFC24_02280 [Methanoregulaceae archaeon]